MIKKSKLVTLTLLVLSVLLVSMLLFTWLYKANNKYTAKGDQGINGLLILSQSDLAQVPIHYLIREWECYPDQLLSPDDFHTQTPNVYKKLVAIGQYNGMEFGQGSRPPHGSASYRLTLDLPEEEAYYAIRVPVIYSAYRMYINDILMMTMGDPDPTTYHSEVQTQTIVFQGSGRVQLLFAVTDYTWLYSGMVYPPAFGLSQSIAALDTAELVLRTMVLALSFLGILLFLYASINARWYQGWIFVFIGFCFIGYTLPPLLHIVTATHGQYANTMLISCFYAMIGFVVYLQCQLYHINKKGQIFIILFFLAATLISLWVGFMAPVLKLSNMLMFSSLITFIKWSSALFLVGLSVYGFYQKKTMATTILWVSLFFSSALLFDRIYPLYEPIYGGWFIEIGGAVLVTGIACTIWTNLSNAHRFELTYNEYMRQTMRQLEIQKVHYQQLSEQMDVVRMTRHDLRHHMRLLQGLADNHNLDGLKHYLDAYKPVTENKDLEHFTGHITADSILCHYAYIARDKGIEFDAKVNLPNSLSISDEEICVLFSNLLENAVEACDLQGNSKKSIYVRCQISSNELRLVMDNTFTSNAKKIGSQGIGTRSIQAIIKHHHGMLSTSTEDHIYKVSIILPLKK